MQATDVRDRWQEFLVTRDPALRDQLIMQYAPLVKYVIGRMSISLPGGVGSEDLLSYGTIGLVQAVDRFDPGVGVKFETYAFRRIRGSIVDAIRSLQPLSRDAYRRIREIEDAYDVLAQRLGRAPEEQEVADQLGWDVEAVRTAQLEGSITFTSIDTSHADDGDERAEYNPILFQIVDSDSGDVSNLVERRELLNALTRALQELPERDRLVISLYYYEELTLKEISEVLGISTSRVSQLHAGAVFRLRGLLRSALSPAA
jgi:RNA polymerase sigma factor for flagellar operon FliA